MVFLMQAEFDNESQDWLAVIPELPGCLQHGPTKESALRKVQASALQFLAYKTERGELGADPLAVEFREAKPDEQQRPEALLALDAARR